MSGTRKSGPPRQFEVVIEPGAAGDFLRPFVARMRAARDRVGDQALPRLSWLVSLVQKDPQEMRHLLALEPDSDLRMELGWFATFDPDPGKVEPADQIVEAMGRVRDCLQMLRPDWDYTLSLTFPGGGTISCYFSVVPKQIRPRWSGAIESYFSSDHFPTAFLLSAADVIKAEGFRVRECARPECGRLFVKKKRGTFCSLQCSQRERDRRFREHHTVEEIRQRRHGLYKREVETKYGSARARHVRPRTLRKEEQNARTKTRER